MGSLSQNGLMFYIKMKGLKALVIGAGRIARRRIFKLRSAGADVTVVADKKPEQQLRGVRFEVADGLEYVRRHVEEFDIVVAATNNEELNNAIADLALKKRKLVSVTTSQMGNIFFPAIIHINGVQIGVSTEGRSPLITKFVKGRLLKAFTREDLAWIEFVFRARKVLQHNGFSPFMMKEFLKSLDMERALNMSDGEILAEARAWVDRRKDKS